VELSDTLSGAKKIPHQAGLNRGFTGTSSVFFECVALAAWTDDLAVKCEQRSHLNVELFGQDPERFSDEFAGRLRQAFSFLELLIDARRKIQFGGNIIDRKAEMLPPGAQDRNVAQDHERYNLMGNPDL